MRDLPDKDTSLEVLLETVPKQKRGHTCFNTYDTVQTVAVGWAWSPDVLLLPFSLKHMPVVAVWKFVVKKLTPPRHPPKRKTGAVIFKCSLVGMNPYKNENQTISYHAWEGQEGALGCSNLWRFPSGSHLPHQIVLWFTDTSPLGSSSQNPKSINRAVNQTRLPLLLSGLGIWGEAQGSVFRAAHLVPSEVG